MVIIYNMDFQEALKRIKYSNISHQFIIHKDNFRVDHSHDLISKYGDAKWSIIDLLNNNYSGLLKNKFDLYNWLNHNEDDEVSYFINEVGSNSLNYSKFKAPYKFDLFLGEQGFIISIEQKGSGFNALEVDQMMIKENEGAGFNFFRNCKNIIFFDDYKNAKIINLQYLF